MILDFGFGRSDLKSVLESLTAVATSLLTARAHCLLKSSKPLAGVPRVVRTGLAEPSIQRQLTALLSPVQDAMQTSLATERSALGTLPTHWLNFGAKSKTLWNGL
ncbi:MAG: hypothetical protein RMY34_22935 [Aulosira sp. DedQUE10]|nr:hypothetical protein [Aulosira sp. DedQUE10]